MKYKKGFIQIPVLITVILTTIIVGGAGYFVVNKTTSVNEQKNLNDQIKTEEINVLKKEIEDLKVKQVEQEEQQQIVERQIRSQEKVGSQSLSISAEEIAPYLTGIVLINCPNGDGSGSLWKLNHQYVVVTNSHVLEPEYIDKCSMDVIDEGGSNIVLLGVKFSPDGLISGPVDTDLTIARILPFKNNSESLRELAELNYKISSLRKCPLMPVGSPVIITGFPLSVRVPGAFGYGRIALRASTNGIISAHENFTLYPSNVPFANYFVSAKIDSGNSGGIAFSKDKSGLCVLGLPTWLTVGNYDTQGIVQNINNLIK